MRAAYTHACKYHYALHVCMAHMYTNICAQQNKGATQAQAQAAEASQALAADASQPV